MLAISGNKNVGKSKRRKCFAIDDYDGLRRIFAQSRANTDETPCTWWCACVAIREFSAILHTNINRNYSIFLCFKMTVFFSLTSNEPCLIVFGVTSQWNCDVVLFCFFFVKPFSGANYGVEWHTREKKSPISRLKTTIYQWIKRRQHNKRLLRDRAAQFVHRFFSIHSSLLPLSSSFAVLRIRKGFARLSLFIALTDANMWINAKRIQKQLRCQNCMPTKSTVRSEEKKTNGKIRNWMEKKGSNEFGRFELTQSVFVDCATRSL